MKNIFKVFGFIALVAVIGFSFAACGGDDDDDGGGNNNGKNNNNNNGTAPTITTASLPNGTVGTAYSQTLTATGETPITWSIDSGTLPTGLSLAGTGVISGTPTTAATSAFTVKAINAKGNNTKSLSITIATGSGQNVIDTALNGMWRIAGEGMGYRFNNGIWELTYDADTLGTISETIVEKGTYTTNNGRITGTRTHIIGDVIREQVPTIDSKLYTIDELINICRASGVYSEEQLSSMRNQNQQFTSSYSVNGNTLNLQNTSFIKKL